jgi:uncharacterized protein (DUF169 family)
MKAHVHSALPGLLAALDIDEEPLGLYYTDQDPAEGFSPKPMELPTREREDRNVIDWNVLFKDFSCVMKHIRWARMKKRAAYFSAEQFGCPGGAFWLGFSKPQTQTIVKYVSTGIPGWTDGERYCESPQALHRVLEEIDPVPAPKKYCVVQPLSLFPDKREPLLVLFFSRPESLCGLHQLAFFVTNDPETVSSPWSSGCGSIAAWPLRYLAKGRQKAVLGGWDPSARSFFKNDELSFTIPFQMFTAMIARYDTSFLVTKDWGKVRKRINRSRKAWSETR